MSLFISSLNSGSNGNCYYVGNEREAVLVDAGISCRETETRMERLGLSMEKVKAIFVSHEHTDHIRGIPVLAKKYGLPVYITPGTARGCRFSLRGYTVKSFGATEPVVIGELAVTAFEKHHDASDPHSFVISYDGIKVGVFTDIGAACDRLVHHFKDCHAAFLEANYDEEMLDKGRYPVYLKNRIRGGKGHLSNKQALSVFKAHRPAHMSHLLLAHLSKENNCPRLVHRLFSEHAHGVEVVVASRFAETPVFRVTGEAVVREYRMPVAAPSQPVQGALF